MSLEYVRPYVKAQKNDDRDAEAIAEAAVSASGGSNSMAAGVLGSVSSGTPGSGTGFGASVSGTANQNGLLNSSTGFSASGGIGTPTVRIAAKQVTTGKANGRRV
jgi:hypothetical protein